MVFSFFKKDPKDNPGPRKGVGGASPAAAAPARSSSSASPMPAGRQPAAARQNGGDSSGGPRSTSTGSTLPNREVARSLAMQTAAKIDAIEREMARDFLGPGDIPSNPSADARTPAPVNTAAASQDSAKATTAIADDVFNDDNLDCSVSRFITGVGAVEFVGSGDGSVIDEAAILFADGQSTEAEEALRLGIDNGRVGAAEHQAWMMLFELVNQRDDKAAFDQLSRQFAVRFGDTSPGWVDYSAIASAPVAPAALPAPAAAKPTEGASVVGIDLPPAVDGGVVKALATLKGLSAQHSTLVINASAVRSIDLVGAELLLRVVNAFKRSSHQLTILGCDHLLAPLRACVHAGRRDPSDAAWMLLLEVLCLLDRQNDFEEMAIQYCITFEVSPPSWAAAPVNLKIGAATAVPVAPAPVAAPLVPGPLDWHGAIDGEGEPYLSRLAGAARGGEQLVVDCRYLKRIGFSAASALLSLLMKLQAGSTRVVLNNVNPLVAALLNLLGVTAVAAVQPRRA